MDKKSSYLSIGEMSRYSGITTNTLRYYDEIDLLKPVIRNEDSEYRLYSRRQLEIVLLIQSLKALGMPLKNVKLELDNMSSRRYAELLKLRAASIDEEIAELKNKRSNLDGWINEVDEAIHAVKGRGYIRHYPAMTGYAYRCRITSRNEHELAMREIEHIFGGGKHVGRVIRMVSSADFTAQNYLIYSGFFIPKTSAVGIDESRMRTMTIPENDYAVMFTAALHEDSYKYWEELDRFARRLGYRIAGDAMRSIPIEFGISRIENDYVSKLFFPVTAERR